MDAERKVAAAIFLTAVGKDRRWKIGKENKFINPKKPILFHILEFTLMKGHGNNDENGAGEEE